MVVNEKQNSTYVRRAQTHHKKVFTILQYGTGSKEETHRPLDYLRTPIIPIFNSFV